MLETAVRSERLHGLAWSVLSGLLGPEDRSVEAEFLRSHATGEQRDRPAESLDQYLANPAPRDGPLLKLAREIGLIRLELLIVALAEAVETDLMCGRAIAHLQAPLGGSRPTLGLLAAAFGNTGGEAAVIGEILTGAGVGSGLLQVSGEEAPLAERFISIPVPLCLALNGESLDGRDASWPAAILGAAGNRDVPLPPSLLTGARKQAVALSAGAQRTLCLRSGSMAEAKAVASEIAQSLGRRALFIDAEKSRPSPVPAGLGPWLALRQALPVFCFELGPGERKALPLVPHYRGPQLALCGHEGSLEAGGDTVPGWTIGVAQKDERIGLWENALGDSTLAAQLAGHRHGAGRIAQLGRLARHHGILEGRATPRLEDVLAASWMAEGVGLEALAQALPERIPDEALVMTPVLRDELNRLLLRCRGREGLADSLGASASARYRPGVRALFTGPSGTGKTLAAGWLATRLGLPLYRVDLAAVTSKYIGETEKNLAQLLARAEHAEVILLFDEADSMFGKRTDVKESNDRFANAQTNYLLQRLESFDGIVLLTSNSRARFDPAFFRRLETIVEFPVPGPQERRSLWQSHLGAGHSLSQRELNQLAAAADLMGGNIRNAVLTAAVLARVDNRPIGYGDVLQALRDEYRKLGRQVPSELSGIV